MGLALPLAIAVLLGGVLGALSPPGMFAVIALALLISLAGSRFVAALLVVTLSLSVAQVLLARGAVLPSGLSGADLTVSGKITELSDEGRFTRLRLAVETCQPLESWQLGCDRLGLVRVNWYRAPSLAVGERWSLTLRLRVPHGFANPDTFDYGAWLWREGIDATGYVRESPAPHRLVPSPGSLRQRALAFLDSHVEDDLTRRWLAALTLGAGQRLTDDDWDLLNATGTTHLMVVSGLHIGLAAAFVLWLSRGLARCRLQHKAA
ncbi:Competence protein [Modicisalibacter muralis]|uniref:Competence protein n=1 Tax=Modicisalibacter muralis TaxID=119000 RepID=A0A1G9LNG2_9GAMM|nr:ComEC/Rec2 family competence protein [Halomonas muralis]SDL63466.1 Competence protein [Halomonas muralis]